MTYVQKPRTLYLLGMKTPSLVQSGVLLNVGRSARSSSRRPPLRQPRLSSATHPGESLDDELHRLAGYQQTSVSLKATLDTGLGLLLPAQDDASGLTRRQRTLIQIATFLRRELPVRLARRVIELQQLPEGLHAMPSVQRVRTWYIQSFVEIRRSRMPIDPEVLYARAVCLLTSSPLRSTHATGCVRTLRQTEAEFHQLLQNIYERHAPTLITMARGVYELRQSLLRQRGHGFEFGDVASSARLPFPRVSGVGRSHGRVRHFR